MVKVGILGADNSLAGELIRILIKHPETELTTLYAPELLGRNASMVHHGLIGEPSLLFTDKVNMEDLDLAILLERSIPANYLINNFSDLENIKLIVLNKDFHASDNQDLFKIGLSEVNRKALVREARAAVIPSPIIIPALIALVPLANFLLLNSDIEITVSLPEDMLELIDLDKEAETLGSLLRLAQTSFSGKIKLIGVTSESTTRGAFTKIMLSNSLAEEEIEKIYDGIYDDHNFTFITKKDLDTIEVEGSQKVLINIKKPETDKLELDVVSDARLRGGAGDIIHVMNLFFGLHEKTGLDLRASRFF